MSCRRVVACPNGEPLRNVVATRQPWAVSVSIERFDAVRAYEDVRVVADPICRGERRVDGDALDVQDVDADGHPRGAAPRHGRRPTEPRRER